MMLNMKSILFVLGMNMFVFAFCGPVNHLDVFIARRELKRFFPDFYGDFYIIRKGVIDNFVQNKATVTGFLPAIAPKTQSLELKFQSKYKLYYKLYLASSDQNIMKQPTATIKLNGHVPKKARPFKIRFPCTRRKTGTAMLRVKMEFMLPSKKKSQIAEFDLILKRSCEKAQEIMAPKPPKTNYICSKKCDKMNVMRRFCLSDFAIRARVETSRLAGNGRTVHKVRVTKYYKRSRVTIGKKIDIEIFGREMTCNCEPLQVRKTYLILGKERSRTSTFFLDNFSYAIEWSKGGKKMAKLHKKRKTCPRKFGMLWYPIQKS